MEIINISTEQILWHPLIRNLPVWANDSEEMMWLSDDIAAHGLHQPLIVCETMNGEDSPYYILLDGRHRHRAALIAGVDELPAVMRSEQDAVEIVLSSLTQRRHMGKGALAYLCYPVISEAALAHGGDRKSKYTERTLISDGGGKSEYTERTLISDCLDGGGQTIRISCKSKSIQSTLISDEGEKSKSSEKTLISVEELCARSGFGRTLFFQAQALHEHFRRRPDLRASFEGRILNGELSLGAALAGIAGQEATKGKARADRTPAQLLMDTCRTLGTRWVSTWDKLEGEQRMGTVNALVESVLDMPEDVQDTLERAIGAVRRGREA